MLLATLTTSRLLRKEGEKESVMKCVNCGIIIPDDANNCPECGASQSEEAIIMPLTCAECDSLLTNNYGELKCPQCGPVIVDNIREEDTDRKKNKERKNNLTFLGMTAIDGSKTSKKIRKRTVDEKEKGRTRLGIPILREIKRPSEPDNIGKALKALSEERAGEVLEKIDRKPPPTKPEPECLPSVMVTEEPAEADKPTDPPPPRSQKPFPQEHPVAEPVLDMSWQDKKNKILLTIVILILIIIGGIIFFTTNSSFR